MRRRSPRKPRPVTRTKSCNGKRRFHDKQEATAALHILITKSSRTTLPTRAYSCPKCKGWHLTSRPDNGG